MPVVKKFRFAVAVILLGCVANACTHSGKTPSEQAQSAVPVLHAEAVAVQTDAAAPALLSMELPPPPAVASAQATQAPDGLFDVRLSFRPPATETAIQSISLAGSFNNWSRESAPLSDRDNDGAWTVAARLPEGRHSYKFVVTRRDGSVEWYADPSNPLTEGGEHANSLLPLGALASLEKSPAVRGDGRVALQALLAENRPGRLLAVELVPKHHDTVSISPRIRALAHDLDGVELEILATDPPIPGLPGVLPMRSTFHDRLMEFFEPAQPIHAKFPAATTDSAIRIQYRFRLKDGAAGSTWPAQPLALELRPDDAPRVPDWARGAVWYQIMLDRFRNGDPSNDPTRQTLRWTSDWYREDEPIERKLAAEGQTRYQWIVWGRTYGGDLAGLRKSIPHLKSLGVTALYLTPVFKAESYSKYNATDYRHIDDVYGTRGDWDAVVAKEDLLDPTTWTFTPSDRLFLDVVRELKAAGIRVVLDGVFNHVGTDHPAFQDVQKNGQNSPFAGWFNIQSWQPFKYEGWAGYGGLPVFKETDDGFTEPAVRKHIFDVTKRWMDPNGDGDPSDGIDGWRLDVANEVSKTFWRDWCAHVRSINPDAYISGEIWSISPDWVGGGMFDALMNYPFARACVAFCIDRETAIDAEEFDKRLGEIRLAYAPGNSHVMMNLIDSHDTDRVASMAWNPDRNYNDSNRMQHPGTKYRATRPPEEAFKTQRLIAFLQQTWLGAPMFWYGSEVGMWGANDPDDRKPMPWPEVGKFDNPEEYIHTRQLAYFQKLGTLRQTSAALREGDAVTLRAEPGSGIFIFERRFETETVLVAVNRDREPRTVAIPAGSGNYARPGAAVQFFNVDSTPDATSTGTLGEDATLLLPAQSGAIIPGN